MFVERTYEEHLELVEALLPDGQPRGIGPRPHNGKPRWWIPHLDTQVFATVDALESDPMRPVYHVSWSTLRGGRGLRRHEVQRRWFPEAATGIEYSSWLMEDGHRRHDLLWRVPTG